jgi:hypothetical protein
MLHVGCGNLDRVGTGSGFSDAIPVHTGQLCTINRMFILYFSLLPKYVAPSHMVCIYQGIFIFYSIPPADVAVCCCLDNYDYVLK